METTGLSPYTNEIIELGLVLFAFNRQTGKIIEVLEEYTGLREPVCSISWGASRVHGLTKRQLKGKDLDREKIASLLRQAEFLVSHNARFDYAFVAPFFPEAVAKPWYCSMNGVSWRKEGFGSKGLQSLLVDHQIAVARSHRALDDARAVVALLGRHDRTGKPYLTALLTGRPLANKTFRKAAATANKK